MKTPAKTLKAKTKICVQESPDIEPKVHSMYDLILSEGAKNCIIPIKAAENPANIIPTMIKEVVEFNLAEKKMMISKASNAPPKEAKQISQELFIQEVNPKTEERKITKATPNPEADVMPKTEGSAKGFRNNSCKSKPLTGKAIPAKMAANVFGKR